MLGLIFLRLFLFSQIENDGNERLAKLSRPLFFIEKLRLWLRWREREKEPRVSIHRRRLS